MLSTKVLVQVYAAQPHGGRVDLGLLWRAVHATNPSLGDFLIKHQMESRSPSGYSLKPLPGNLPIRAVELFKLVPQADVRYNFQRTNSKLHVCRCALNLTRRRTRRQRPIRPPHRLRSQHELHPAASGEYVLPSNPRLIPILSIHLQTLDVNPFFLITAAARNQQRLAVA
jgi:hypothetical protein